MNSLCITLALCIRLAALVLQRQQQEKTFKHDTLNSYCCQHRALVKIFTVITTLHGRAAFRLH